ncbi:hypothetical protein M5E82_06795 [Parabacteroides distasonis]|nr:hypothetical protein M5E82_06795 [Parabacteroides distasonis]
MKTNLLQRKRLLTEESNRCYLCDAPVCTKACKPGLDPGRLLRACKMDNLAGAILRAYRMEACKDCDGHPCEKACLRGRTDRAISITQIVRQLQDMPNPTDSSPSLRLRTWRSTFAASAAPIPLYWPPHP